MWWLRLGDQGHPGSLPSLLTLPILPPVRPRTANKRGDRRAKTPHSQQTRRQKRRHTRSRSQGEEAETREMQSKPRSDGATRSWTKPENSSPRPSEGTTRLLTP